MYKNESSNLKRAFTISPKSATFQWHETCIALRHYFEHKKNWRMAERNIFPAMFLEESIFLKCSRGINNVRTWAVAEEGGALGNGNVSKDCWKTRRIKLALKFEG